MSIVNNHKVINFKNYAQQSISANTKLPGTTGVNTQAESVRGAFELNTKMLLLIEVVVATDGKLNIDVETMNDEDTDFVKLCDIPEIAANGMYMVEVDGFRKNIRLSSTVTGGAVTWNAKGICFDARRGPIKQADSTALTPIYV